MTPDAGPADSLAQLLNEDSPSTTVGGASFVAPAGWTLQVKGPGTILTPPEPDSHLALVDVKGSTADEAVAAAWAAYRPSHSWPLQVATDGPDKDGWTNRRTYVYETSPNEKRTVAVQTLKAADGWTVVVIDLANAVLEKRGGAISTALGRLFPKGYSRESFAGKQAHPLDAARVAELSAFVEKGMAALKVPGVSIGLVQKGKVVFAGGFGVKELGKKGSPDADTLYMVASNTKALTTLMLARLVDQKKLAWDTPVAKVLPSFKLADDDITRQILVKHLICACTGLPRKDLEWLFQFKGMTPDSSLATLANVKPTSKFGEMYQYSNLLAGAGGFVGGHVLYPKLELGKAYDQAMQQEVFDPLGMRSTTFDFGKALKGNHASPHGLDIDGNAALDVMGVNYAIIPLRPAGAAWSSVKDMLAYVSMELANGQLPRGSTYLAQGPLLERRAPQVAIGKDQTYGMGLIVSIKYGTPLVHHGGDLIGYHSDMLWLPEAQVGAVILTNGDLGSQLRGLFTRRLLEVLYDGKPEAEADLAAQTKAIFEQVAAERAKLTVPAAPAEVARLAPHYVSDTLGEIAVKTTPTGTTFDFGEWASEVATRPNPDGTISFITIVPGMSGLELVVGGSGTARTLTTRDAQHEYVFVEQ